MALLENWFSSQLELKNNSLFSMFKLVEDDSWWVTLSACRLNLLWSSRVLPRKFFRKCSTSPVLYFRLNFPNSNIRMQEHKLEHAKIWNVWTWKLVVHTLSSPACKETYLEKFNFYSASRTRSDCSISTNDTTFLRLIWIQNMANLGFSFFKLKLTLLQMIFFLTSFSWFPIPELTWSHY